MFIEGLLEQQTLTEEFKPETLDLITSFRCSLSNTDTESDTPFDIFPLPLDLSVVINNNNK